MFKDLASVFVKISCVAAICVLSSGCGRHGPAEVDMKVDDADSNAAEGTHVVRNNETIYDVAYQYSVDPQNLAKINGLKAPYKLWNGQVLQLPVELDVGVSDYEGVDRKNSRSSAIENKYEKEGYGGYSTVGTASAAVGSTRSSTEAEKEGKKHSEGAQGESGRPSRNDAGTGTMGSKYPSWDDDSEDPRVRKNNELKAARSRDSAKELSTPKISKKSSSKSEGANAERKSLGSEKSQKSDKSEKVNKSEDALEKGKEKSKEKAQKSTPKNSGSSKMVMPVKGRIISRFGDVSDGIPNDGINIKAAKGTSVAAAAGGTVIYVGNKLDEEYGNVVIIQHDGGLITSYAHLDKAKVKKDARVSAGDIIGTVGSTGDVNEPQLYFEVMKDKKPVNPSKYLK